ncbi:MAG: hypothetical protein ACLT8E_00620 [Akkermansia sp.]
MKQDKRLRTAVSQGRRNFLSGQLKAVYPLFPENGIFVKDGEAGNAVIFMLF